MGEPAQSWVGRLALPLQKVAQLLGTPQHERRHLAHHALALFLWELLVEPACTRRKVRMEVPRLPLQPRRDNACLVSRTFPCRDTRRSTSMPCAFSREWMQRVNVVQLFVRRRSMGAAEPQTLQQSRVRAGNGKRMRGAWTRSTTMWCPTGHSASGGRDRFTMPPVRLPCR